MRSHASIVYDRADTIYRNRALCGGYVWSVSSSQCSTRDRRCEVVIIGIFASYTQPVGLGSPASLHAPLAGPEGNML